MKRLCLALTLLGPLALSGQVMILDHHVASFTAATTVNVPASSHGKGATDLVTVGYCHSTSPPASLANGTDYTWSAAGNGTVTITFPNATTGYCTINGPRVGTENGNIRFPDAAISFADGVLSDATFQFQMPGAWDGNAVTVTSIWIAQSRLNWTDPVDPPIHTRVGVRIKCAPSLAAVRTAWTEPATYINVEGSSDREVENGVRFGTRHAEHQVAPVNCASGQRAFLQIIRDGAAGADNSTTQASLHGLWPTSGTLSRAR